MIFSFYLNTNQFSSSAVSLSLNDMIYLTDNDRILKSCIYCPPKIGDDALSKAHETPSIELPRWRPVPSSEIDLQSINSAKVC